MPAHRTKKCHIRMRFTQRKCFEIRTNILPIDREMAGEENFLLILFLDDAAERQNIDFVPAEWIVYDDKINHLVTPFPSKLTKTNLRLLSALVKGCCEPLDSWPRHRVLIKGSAKTFVEAEQKIKGLETKTHMFSTDDELHAAAKERDITKKYKSKGKAYNKATVDALFEASEFDLSTETPPTGTKKKQHRIASEKTVKKVSRKVGTKAEKTVADGAAFKRGRSEGPQQRNAPRKAARSDDEKSECGRALDFSSELSSDDSEYDKQIRKIVGDRTTKDSAKEIKENAGSVESQENESVAEVPSSPEHINGQPRVEMTPPSTPRRNGCSGQFKTASNESTVPSLGIDDSDDLKSVFLKGFRSLSFQMGQVLGLLTDLKIRQNEMSSQMSGLRTNTIINATAIDSTAEKYDLGEFPLKTLTQFNDFDAKLKTDKTLRREIMTGMLLHVNANPKHLITSVRDIIKKFMTRTVLQSFTAVKQSAEKKVLKDTTFYVCLRDAVLAEFQTKVPDAPIKEKNIQDAIGSVINSSKDWEGHRMDRITKKKQHDKRKKTDTWSTLYLLHSSVMSLSEDEGKTSDASTDDGTEKTETPYNEKRGFLATIKYYYYRFRYTAYYYGQIVDHYTDAICLKLISFYMDYAVAEDNAISGLD